MLKPLNPTPPTHNAQPIEAVPSLAKLRKSCRHRERAARLTCCKYIKVKAHESWGHMPTLGSATQVAPVRGCCIAILGCPQSESGDAHIQSTIALLFLKKPFCLVATVFFFFLIFADYLTHTAVAVPLALSLFLFRLSLSPSPHRTPRESLLPGSPRPRVC